MKKILILLLFLALLAVKPVSAAYVTGGNLFTSCSSDKNSDVISCANYIAGVIDYHIFLQSIGAVSPTDFCIPKNVTLDEISFKVMKYLQKSHDQYAFIAAPAIVLALGQEYPCRKGR